MDLLAAGGGMTRAWVMAVVVVATSAAPRAGHAQIFSPGELAKPHAALEGLDNCVKCHEPGNRLANTRCLACHSEIKTRVQSGAGFHGRMDKSVGCATCHHEHKGRGHALIPWGDKARFDHARTGWLLRGKHGALSCKQCHEPRRVVASDAKKLASNARSHTMLGLPNECKDCHFDEHRGQVGNTCTQCHKEDRWKPPAKFVHNKMADFNLTGRHTKVQCAKCHARRIDSTTSAEAFPAPRASSFRRFEDIAHGRCIDCHADTHHKGKMGTRCESCHSTSGFADLNETAKDVGFHEKTRFPLRGGHVGVACQTCHGPFVGEKEARYKDLPFQACSDCHLDAHGAQLAKSADRACDTCHTVERFVPVRFGPVDHGRARFALTGAHVAVDCRSCHAPDAKLLALVPPDAALEMKRRGRTVVASDFPMILARITGRCEECHEDAHKGQFADKVKREGCNDCHRDTSFEDVVLDHDVDTRFPLVGRHETADCRSCHVPGADGTVGYRTTTSTCADCHVDEHAGQLARGDEVTSDCRRCHSLAGFLPASFDHNDPGQSAFALRGRHAQVSCDRCHPLVRVDERRDTRWYKGVPTTCAGCHVDEHKGVFDAYIP